MDKPVTLLVCLSPSVQPESVTELSFYTIVNPIAPVRNIKMIAREGQMKAFVEVTSIAGAELIIEKLHCKLLNIGKIKVFVSNKNHINYDQPLHKLIGHESAVSLDGCLRSRDYSHGEIPGFKSGLITSHKKFAQNHRRESDVSAEQKDHLKKIESKETYDVSYTEGVEPLDIDARVMLRDTRRVADLKGIQIGNSRLNSADKSKGVIRVTHNEIESLAGKKISKIFRRFGKIKNLSFNHDGAFWIVEYFVDKEARKAEAAMHNNKLFGYRSVDSPVNTLHKLEDLISQSFEQPSFQDVNNLESQLQNSFNFDEKSAVALRVDTISSDLSLTQVCKFIAGIHMPVKIVQAYDLNKQRHFFFVDFANEHDAFEVFSAINSTGRRQFGLVAEYRG